MQNPSILDAAAAKSADLYRVAHTVLCDKAKAQRVVERTYSAWTSSCFVVMAGDNDGDDASAEHWEVPLLVAFVAEVRKARRWWSVPKPWVRHQDLLLEAVRSLPQAEMECVLLRDVLGVTLDVAARVCGLSGGTKEAASILADAHRLLDERLVGTPSFEVRVDAA